MMIGDPAKLKIHVENSGNMPTNIKISAHCPDPIKPAKIVDSFENLIPWAPIQRSFDLKIDKPGEYSIDKIEITYSKSSKEKEVVKVKPVNLIVHGRPVVQIDVEGDENVKLGDEMKYYISLKNTGSAPARSVRVDISYPTSIHITSAQLVLPELDQKEESMGVLRLNPLFTGGHTLKIKAVYSSPPMGNLAPMTFESTIKEINLSVKK
jgi:uncharacterized repeat protein (TIGR01451 family)